MADEEPVSKAEVLALNFLHLVVLSLLLSSIWLHCKHFKSHIHIVKVIFMKIKQYNV